MSPTFETTSGVLAYRKYVPNRVAIGIPLTAKGEGDWISLPFVSILRSPADKIPPTLAYGEMR